MYNEQGERLWKRRIDGDAAVSATVVAVTVSLTNTRARTCVLGMFDVDAFTRCMQVRGT